MGGNETIVAYLTAGVCFILALGGLSKQETARQGNVFGVVGMVIALIATALQPEIRAWEWIGGAILIGGVIGAIMAKRVVMTAMPELVALLHSFVGLAAVLVGLSSYLAPEAETLSPAEHSIHQVEIWIGIAIGSITFTGSVIAWGKLRGSISGKPLLIPARHLVNLAMVGATIGLAWPFTDAIDPMEGLKWALIMTAITGVLGMHLVMAIGGADMPVVVSLLNSYSGWAAAAAGFVLRNDLLIVTGALVGSSGAILSIIMCRAMNRSILNVVFGGFGTADGSEASGDAPEGEIVEITADALVEELKTAKEVVIVPGYGMAVARAQHPVKEMVKLLQARGVKVRFAIHPVAGRLPGHMNVLLAEAGVPYDIVLEMDEINEDFGHTDVVLIIGANDIVNPGALTDDKSPIYGMPVLEVWEAKRTVVFKRGMSAGYAGVGNPLFFEANNRMLFGDAKKSVDALVASLRD